jgi:hypothetical protein
MTRCSGCITPTWTGCGRTGRPGGLPMSQAPRRRTTIRRRASCPRSMAIRLRRVTAWTIRCGRGWWRPWLRRRDRPGGQAAAPGSLRCPGGDRAGDAPDGDGRLGGVSLRRSRRALILSARLRRSDGAPSLVFPRSADRREPDCPPTRRSAAPPETATGAAVTARQRPSFVAVTAAQPRCLPRISGRHTPERHRRVVADAWS